MTHSNEKYRSDVLSSFNKVFKSNPFDGLMIGIISFVALLFLSVILYKIYNNPLGLTPAFMGIFLELYIVKAKDYGLNPFKWKKSKEQEDLEFKRLCDILTSDENRIGKE